MARATPRATRTSATCAKRSPTTDVRAARARPHGGVHRAAGRDDGGDGDAASRPSEPQPAPQPQPQPVPAPAPAVTVQPAPVHGHGTNGAWLAVGGTVALATIGGVLAFSATSSEQDIKDLYVGVDHVPPVFDGTTQKRYDDLIDEGHRYQDLSWAAFGAAAVCAGLSAYLFVRGHASHEHVALRPVVAPQLVGLGASGSF